MQGIELEDLSATGRKRPWNQHKEDNEKLVRIFENLTVNVDDGYRDKVLKLTDCGNKLTFAECQAHGYRKLQKAYFCKCRFCFICTWRKSLYVYHQFNQVAHKTLENHPGTKFLFATFTTKNVTGDILKSELKRLNDGFAKLHRYKRVKDSVKGFFRSSEVTYNPLTDEYNPHIHAVLAVDSRYFGTKYIKQGEWTDLWQKAMKLDYKPMVDIRKVKGKREDLNTIQEDLIEDQKINTGALAAAGAEVAKYSVAVKQIIEPVIKPSDSQAMKDAKTRMRGDTEWQSLVIHTLEEQMFRVRMQSYGGVMRKAYQELNLKDVDKSDLITMPDEDKDVCTCPICQSELVQVHYLWNYNFKKYFTTGR